MGRTQHRFISAYSLRLGTVLLFTALVLAVGWARVWRADRRVDLPTPDLIPGDSAPSTYWCDWPRMAGYIVPCEIWQDRSGIISFTQDLATHKVLWASYRGNGLRIGDLIVALGEPTVINASGSRPRSIRMCWQRPITICATAFGLMFSANLKAATISYDDDPPTIRGEWHGFTQR